MTEDQTNSLLILTLEEVAELLRLQPEAVVELLELGDLRGFKVHGEWRILSDDLTAFLSARLQEQQLIALRRRLTDPRTQAAEIEKRHPDLAQQIREGKFAEGTFGRWLQAGLSQLSTEKRAGNVIPLDSRRDN